MPNQLHAFTETLTLRFSEFQVTVIILTTLAIITFIVDKIYAKKAVKQQKKHGTGYISYASIIFAPIFEEWLFRLPLIILYPSLTNESIGGIFILAIGFTAIHGDHVYSKNSMINRESFSKKHQKRFDIFKSHQRKIHIFSIGFILGYIAVLSQNIILVISLHAAINITTVADESLSEHLATISYLKIISGIPAAILSVLTTVLYLLITAVFSKKQPVTN